MKEGTTFLAAIGAMAPSRLWLSWAMAALLLRCLSLCFVSPPLLTQTGQWTWV